MTATLNGKPARKQLSDQLDRLDGILDVLADALPQAVADACREGAKQAVKDAVLELMANPDVRRLLAGTPAPPPIPYPPIPPSPFPVDLRPSWWERLKAKVREMKEAVAKKAKAAVTGVSATAKVLTSVLPLKRIALVAGAVGLTVGVVALVCPPFVAAVVSAVGGAVTTGVVQVTGALRRAGVLAPAAD